jgi:hypothetical protein
MAFQRARRPSLRSGRSLRSLGSPLNAYPLCGGKVLYRNSARKSSIGISADFRSFASVDRLIGL